MGLREGEVLALSWHNIDFEHGTVLFPLGTGIVNCRQTSAVLRCAGCQICRASSIETDVTQRKRQMYPFAELMMEDGTVCLLFPAHKRGITV